MLVSRHRVAWLVVGLLSIVLSSWTVIAPNLYDGLIAPTTRAGALSQDMISMLAGIALSALAVWGRAAGPKADVVALGLLGYLFYGYGIYVIERVYNILYLGYLAVFAISFWSLVAGSVELARVLGPVAVLDRRTRWVSALGALLQPAVFYPLWIGSLIPLMVHRDQIDSLYSIFILDLCFIMPAFVFVAVGTFLNRGVALVLAPVMYVLGAALIFSLVVGELVKPLFDKPVTVAGLLPPTVLTMIFIGLGALHLGRLGLRRRVPAKTPAVLVVRCGSLRRTTER